MEEFDIAFTKTQLGTKGVGMDLQLGKRAALESYVEVKEALM